MREKLIELLGNVYLPMTCGPDTIGEYRIPHKFKREIADHLIANGVVVSKMETTTRWISVTERLPEREQTVLVIDRVTGEVTTAYLNFCDSFVFEDGRGHGASHWMPLPEPPKGE